MTEREQLIDALNEAFTRKLNSAARYVLEAEPFVRPGREDLLEALRGLAESDRRIAERLATTIERLEGIPQPGINAPESAGWHYLDLDYLAEKVIGSIEGRIGVFERLRGQLGEQGQGRTEMDRLIAADRGQIELLRQALGRVPPGS